MSSSPPPSADDLRQQGNHQFQQRNFEAAVSLYSAALELVPADSSAASILLCNRSACWYQLQQYENSCHDACAAMAIDGSVSMVATPRVTKDNLKATYRLAKTLVAMEDYQSAKELIQQAMQEIDSASQPEVCDPTTLPPPQGYRAPSWEEQRKSFQDLYHSLIEGALRKKPSPEPTTVAAMAQHRALSIREFDKGEELGYGNFSQILVVTHKTTQEQFALKLIEKKQAADLAKRQHPNVYNEIQMERRVLLERVPSHIHLIRMWAAFQDYTTIYYLMDLCDGDLWNQLKWRGKLVGCHSSQARTWMLQLISAVEHLHSFGIVHRDLKPENVLLKGNRVVVIDLGTAKDLVQTDLNGPEFVGTPDFMSPEAVNGNSIESDDTVGTGADLWALGAILYVLTTGKTPFWSPSPYLAFLRIKRCNLTRDAGIYDDDTWDLIQRLMQRDPAQRLGTSVYSILTTGGIRRVQARSGGYECIRQHTYFDKVDPSVSAPLPSLTDLCYRAVAEQVEQDSQNLEVSDHFPPGDGSLHDMLRLKREDRAAVLHLLDRLTLVRDARLYTRFFADPVSLLLSKVRPDTRDFVGLTQMNDNEYKPPKATMNDPYSEPEDSTIVFVHLTCRLFHESPSSKAERSDWAKVVKRCISDINTCRPQLVVATGFQLKDDLRCLKLLTRISETISVVVVNGSSFFNFWFKGVECVALADEDLEHDDSPQTKWLRERTEQVRLSKHPFFCFCARDPHTLPNRTVKRLSRGRSLAIFGPGTVSTNTLVTYQANEMVGDSCIRSDSSEEDHKDEFTTQLTSTSESGVRWISVDEEPGEWKERFHVVT